MHELNTRLEREPEKQELDMLASKESSGVNWVCVSGRYSIAPSRANSSGMPEW